MVLEFHEAENGPSRLGGNPSPRPPPASLEAEVSRVPGLAFRPHLPGCQGIPDPLALAPPEPQQPGGVRVSWSRAFPQGRRLGARPRWAQPLSRTDTSHPRGHGSVSGSLGRRAEVRSLRAEHRVASLRGLTAIFTWLRQGPGWTLPAGRTGGVGRAPELARCCGLP